MELFSTFKSSILIFKFKFHWYFLYYLISITNYYTTIFHICIRLILFIANNYNILLLSVKISIYPYIIYAHNLFTLSIDTNNRYIFNK